jgi:hypothetical protein
MVQKAFILMKPNYQIEVLDQKTGGGVRVTMIVNNPDGSVKSFSHIGPNKGVAKGLCAEEALSSTSSETCSINYTFLCNILSQVSLMI